MTNGPRFSPLTGVDAMLRESLCAGAFVSAILGTAPAVAEPVVWGIQVEENEYRVTEGDNVYAWDLDAFVGTDELKLVYRSEGEFAFGEDVFEDFENQIRVQTPISTFWDAVVGVRVDTASGPNQVFGVIGLHGLGPQFIEVDIDLFIADDPALRFELEYEGLITQRITATPVIEVDLPLSDNPEFGLGAFAPKLELGLRVSYDLIDRAVSPYIGVFYERAFGETSVLTQAEGENSGEVSFVVGARLQF